MCSNATLGPVFVDIAGIELAPEDRTLLSHPLVGGVILFTRNYRDIDQLQALVAAIKAVNSELIVSVDHEGGRVQRFREGFSAIPSMQKLGRACLREPQSALEYAREVGWLLAAELIACGIDISFAPVLDVDEDLSDVIGDRSFSDSPINVIIMAQAFIKGMNDAGMAATGKHFPGHGGVKADSHVAAPEDPRSIAELEQRDLVPFRALSSRLGAIMPAHVTFPNIDPMPVGFSPWWIKQFLRNDLGFKGVVFSDDLSMQGAAVAGGYGERAVQALNAGCDAILVCNNREGALAAVTRLEEEPQLTTSSNIASMLSIKRCDMQSLKSTDRWHQAQRILEKI